jgi:uncharacterized protein
MIALTHDEGIQLVRIARGIVEGLFQVRLPFSETFQRSALDAGVFVTILDCSTSENSLRGCIGFPIPKGEFYTSLAEAAIAAATKDPRFKPISENELDKIIFEVSVLSRPELITVEKPIEYLDKVRIGVDGLMFSWGNHSSLLLPQVAVEWGWSPDEYLCNLCCKAGLAQNMWMTDGAKIYKFTSLVYKEREPGGEVYQANIFGL